MSGYYPAGVTERDIDALYLSNESPADDPDDFQPEERDADEPTDD